jgi:hypothetical protein
MRAPATAELSLLRRWVVARVRLTLRNPRALFGTFALPLVLVTLFDALNRGAHVSAMGDAGGKVPFAQFYTPSIGIFGLGPRATPASFSGSRTRAIRGCSSACAARRCRCRSTSARGWPARR